MKKLPVIITSIIMAVLMASLAPMQVFAAGEENSGDYISEVRIGVGKTAEEAEASLKGYTILKNGDENADLNKGAGGGLGSKGERVVYLGYKTTNKKTEAVTDMAVMNMKGDYSVKEYEVLMENQMKNQIIPFVNDFLAAVREYRENCNSKNKANKQRALYIRDNLNKFTDDDTGKGLGNLLLNKTKYELGDAEYNKLSAEEKKEHADILTIVAQSNGNATLMMENYITRASDTNKNSWVDRFIETSYDDMLDELDMLPTDGKKKLSKLYDDDAKRILEMWSVFRERLLGADEAKERLEKMSAETIDAQTEANEAATKDIDAANTDEKDINNLSKTASDAELTAETLSSRLMDVVAKAYLENVEYGDGTLYDFFTQERGAIEKDITVLYPMVASLSDGQRAGLEFVSLSDLVAIAGTKGGDYKDEEMDKMEPVSIYDGVDRGIYEKGGVALTGDAVKNDFTEADWNDNSASLPIHWWTMVSAGVTLATATAFGISVGKWVKYSNRIKQINNTISSSSQGVKSAKEIMYKFGYDGIKNVRSGEINIVEYNEILRKMRVHVDSLASDAVKNRKALDTELERVAANSSTCKWLSIGLGVAVIVMVGITTYLSYRDLVDHYKIDFTPIPHYMVDKADIITYNSKGEQVVIKNQAAYYKAVECNRTSDDEMYKALGSCADLNGDVGKQWLALYVERNQAKSPILASSLLVKYNPKEMPANYETGIHMFGSDSAADLNDHNYVWNGSADAIYVYFNTSDSTGASAAGSVFNGGQMALASGIGLLAGALITAIIMTVTRKRKEQTV